MIDALVPVKRLGAAKTRLLPPLDRPAAERLTLAMLEDVLEALTAAERIDRVAVVTPDREVVQHAEQAGAVPLLFPDPGLNPSLDWAAEKLAADGGSGLLVLLGDVAGAASADLDAACLALEDLGSPGAVICPSGDGGTAALLRSPHDAIPSCFGPGSGQRHLQEAVERGVPHRELTLPSLTIDLDQAGDVDAFLRCASGGQRTRALLSELGWKTSS